MTVKRVEYEASGDHDITFGLLPRFMPLNPPSIIRGTHQFSLKDDELHSFNCPQTSQWTLVTDAPVESFAKCTQCQFYFDETPEVYLQLFIKDFISELKEPLDPIPSEHANRAVFLSALGRVLGARAQWTDKVLNDPVGQVYDLEDFWRSPEANVLFRSRASGPEFLVYFPDLHRMNLPLRHPASPLAPTFEIYPLRKGLLLRVPQSMLEEFAAVSHQSLRIQRSAPLEVFENLAGLLGEGMYADLAAAFSAASSLASEA